MFELFVSKSKANCRKFTETFTVAGKNGEGYGVGCKREGSEGWCKLKTSNAHTCAMEPPRNIIQERIRGANDAVQSGEGIWGRIMGWLR